MRPSVYIETSVISYLCARPSRNVLLSAHQQLTRLWWRGRCGYRLFVWQLVLDEAAAGDRAAQARRLRILRAISLLPLTDKATRLADELVKHNAVPPKAAVDAFHIAIAADHRLDYLLTWNCKHIANASMRATIESICRSTGFEPPVICTPEELPTRIPT